MASNNLPDADTVVRYVNKTNVHPGGKGVLSGAFFLREHESGISVFWLQYFQVATLSEQLAEVRVAAKQSNYHMKRSGRLAELRVGVTRERINRAFEHHKCKIQFIHAPSQFNPSHSEIVGIPANDSPEAEMIADLIAESVIQVHEAVPALDELS